MARIRTIKPEFWTSDQVTECSRSSRLLFIGMWNFCDDAGRHVASAKRLKGEVFPCDDITLQEVEQLIDELLDVGLIDLMINAQGVEYWQVTGWHHQVINKPQKARIQEGEHLIHGTVPECYVTTTAGMERKGKERKGKEYSSVTEQSVTEHDNEPADPSFVVFPTNGIPPEWTLRKSQVDQWCKLFPGVDVEGECFKALAWVQANHKKTAKGMPKFLVNWLSRANDRQRASPKKHGPMSMEELDEQVEKLKAERCPSP